MARIKQEDQSLAESGGSMTFSKTRAWGFGKSRDPKASEKSLDIEASKNIQEVFPTS